MNIDKRVYALEPYSKENAQQGDCELYLSRNGRPIYCPLTSGEGGNRCGEWRPAFQLIELRVSHNNAISEPTGKYIVELGCFPQKVVYGIEE